MSNKTKIQVALTILLGCVFLGLAIYQWYDLHLIEQGLKEGSLSIVLHKVYQVAGKWGVAAVYMPFCIYCFWRSYSIIKLHKDDDQYGEIDEENNENKE